MQAFQVFHILILISLTITTSIEAQEYSKPRCRDNCGWSVHSVDIPYPFGIGSNCSFNEWYNVDCKSSMTGPYGSEIEKPYLSSLNNVEVVKIRSSEYMAGIRSNTITVKISGINANCSSPVYTSNFVQTTNHSKIPFGISGSSNVLVFKGCGHASIMEENGKIISGCSTTCQNDTVIDLNSCFGVGCCQTTIPHDLYSFTIKITGLKGHDRDGTCGSAFLVDKDYVGRFPSDFTGEDNAFVPVSFSWNETVYESRRCNETCGDVSIPYPFGIERSCSMSDWYAVDCNSSTPYFMAFNNVEVLGFNSEPNLVTVNVPMVSDCENPLQNTSLFPISESPFFIREDRNVIVVEGCGKADVIVENGTIVGGCSSTCGNDTFSDINNCFGVGCCRIEIPHHSNAFTFDLTGLEKAGDGKCGSAFLVDKNSIIEGIFSREFVPMTLGWAGTTSSPCSECQRRGGICNNEEIDFRCFYESGNRKSWKKSHNGLILGVSISMGSIFLTVIGYMLYKIIKKTTAKRTKQMCFKRNGGLLLKQQQSTDTGLVDKTILFTSNELAKATDNFNENRILGRGGQGTVYKGMLVDGRIVAIKKSKAVNESQLQQFINEVVILSQVNHRNVVKLLGCCLETEVPLLVSEFISNGTLYDFIQDKNGEFSISFIMILQIATEVAGALSYLHSATSIPIYHRDIKTSNILLDEKYRAKVSDFGTSMFVSIDQTHLTTLVKGTFGYLDPEYFRSSQFTDKSDVYSFGVVLLELLTREKPISLTRFGENRSLATHFMLAMEEGRVMTIFDAMVVKEGSSNELLAIANLVMRCLNMNGKNRPTMKEVAMELESIRLSHVPSTVQTNFRHVKQYEEATLK